MRFRKRLYRTRITPRGRHNYYRKCCPNFLKRSVDTKQAYYIKKPNPHRKIG